MNDAVPEPGQRRIGRDFRLILSAAGATSLFWITLIAFVGPDLFGAEKGGDSVKEPAAQASEDAAPPALEDVMPAAQPVSAAIPADSLLVPVDGIAPGDLIDTFHDPRGNDRTHEAIDIPAPTGTPVVAAAEGTVEKLFLSDAGGKTVYVRSPNGERMYYYAHLDAYAPDLAEGGYVRAGQKIGTVGTSGNANPATPHLHFAVLRMTPGQSWWEGAAENPYPLLTTAAGG